MTTRKPAVRLATALAIAAVAVAACGGDALPTASSAPSGPPSSAPSARPSAATAELGVLAAAAEQEGNLTTIGLSHNWCNYGEAISTFTSRYEITVNELSPDAAFADQLQAIKDTKATGGALAPDVIDVDLASAAQAKAAKLLAPYKVSTWDTIPAGAKDPDGAWAGDYYGLLAFETNTTTGIVPPSDWADLLLPAHVNQVALGGDPRVTSQAIAAVLAASLANGGSLDDAKPGLDFFAKLKSAGNLVPRIATPETIDAELTPIAIRWTYNALAHRDSANGSPPIDVTVPTTGRLANLYAQAISAYAPHPNAARLWLEFLYSDEGQNLWLKGNCSPIRYDDLSARSAIPADVVADLPDLSGAVFPTVGQLNAAAVDIAQRWDPVVGADIK